ncbi:MAG: hypothetical protein ABJK39_00695 [Hyphomicrobiales bacterium]
MATTRNTKRTATTVSLLIMLGVMSACSSSGLSFVPANLRASVAAEDAKDNKVSVDDILTSAREQDDDQGGKTVLAKTRGKFASIFKRKKKNTHSPVFQPVETTSHALKTDEDAIASFLEGQTAKPNTVLAKTSNIDTINTASVSTVKKSSERVDAADSRFAKRAEAIRNQFDQTSDTPARKTKTKKRNNLRITSNNARAGDGGRTNAEIAKGWVETGPDDLEGLPIDGFDNDNGAETEAILRGDTSANARFSEYLNKTKSRISNERDYERQLQEASREATYEQDATSVFKAAQRIAKQNPQPPVASQPKVDPVEILARSKALNARNKANAAQATTTNTSNNALLERARALVTRTQPAVPSTTTLVMASGSTNLTAAQQDQFAQFMAAHEGKPLKIEAGLGKEGSTFEKLATAQARLKSLGNYSPAIRAAEQQIKPELQPNTIRLSVKS